MPPCWNDFPGAKWKFPKTMWVQRAVAAVAAAAAAAAAAAVV